MHDLISLDSNTDIHVWRMDLYASKVWPYWHGYCPLFI